jgi:hypothetical protein
MRVRLVVLCVALVLATASCDFDWPMFRFGPARTGSSPDTSISKEAVSSSVALSWTATTGGAVLSSPAVAAGKVYVGSQDDFFRAYDARGEANCSGSPKTCSALWTAGFGGAVRSSPAVANGVVYVGTMNFGDPGVAVANFYAFDAAGVLNCSGTPRICSPLWYGITGPVVQS